MTASEIIEEISQLPEEELGIVKEYISKIPNAETIAAINETIDESRKYSSAAELFADLDKEC